MIIVFLFLKVFVLIFSRVFFSPIFFAWENHKFYFFFRLFAFPVLIPIQEIKQVLSAKDAPTTSVTNLNSNTVTLSKVIVKDGVTIQLSEIVPDYTFPEFLGPRYNLEEMMVYDVCLL